MASPAFQTGLLRVGTWNIHNARGADGRRSLERIGDVIGRMQAEVVGLQEVGCAPGDACDAMVLATRHGYAWHVAPTCAQDQGRAMGNALLTTLPVEDLRIHDLSVAGREPRAALECRLRWQGQPLRVVVTHLGLRAGERRAQVERLLSALGSPRVAATVLLGDINEWLLWGRPLRWLHRRFGASASVRSFPARLPLFALDRIWAEPTGAIVAMESISGAQSGWASDHLPVVATLRMPALVDSAEAAAGPLIASSG